MNGWLRDKKGAAGWELGLVSDHYAGGKHPQQYVAGGGFNYFAEDEFATFVLGLPWEHPENVVLVIQPEDGPTRVFRPTTNGDGKS